MIQCICTGFQHRHLQHIINSSLRAYSRFKFTSSLRMPMKKVIVDCDPGTDDAQAIMMLLAKNDPVNLLAITTVYGNSALNDSSINALKTLKVCNRLDVPVYAGADRSLTGRSPVGDAFHGDDGFGDIMDPEAPGLELIQTDYAALTLTRLAKEMPGEITLVFIGPMTNLAIALRLDKHLGSKYKNLIMMGGNTSGRGNITQSAEFNFYSDPESAKVVLEEWGGPITWIPKEICDETSFDWDWYEKLMSIDSPRARFMKPIEKKWTDIQRKTSPVYNMWDQLAAAIAIDDTVVMETKDVFTTVETGGSLTVGQSVTDWNNHTSNKPNVKLVTKVNQDLYGQLVINGLI